jgi:hypothetical protein
MTRRKSETVSSLFLWRGIREIHREQSLFSKFIRERMFYLHLVILVLLLLALIQFSLGKSSKKGMGKRAVLIMDISASMKTVEGGNSRLDLAKEKALDLISNLRNHEVMIIAAGTGVRTVLPFSRDPGEITNTIKSIQAEETVADIEAAVLQIKSYLMEGISIYLFSDGAFDRLTSIIDVTPNLSFVPIGQTGNNISLKNLEIHEQVEGIYKTVGVLLKNYGSSSVKSEVELFADGKVIDLQRIEIPAGDEKELFFYYVPEVFRNLKAVLNNPDPFLTDNSRYYSQPEHQSTSILLVSKSSHFLRLLLEQLEGHDLTVINPDRYDEVLKQAGEDFYDIGIYDNFSPSTEMSRASIYINPNKITNGIVLSNKSVVPDQLYEFRDHPVMWHTDFSDVKINKARIIKSFEGTTLLESGNSPLIVMTDKNGEKRIISSFDIRDSNFPKSINFPVFFSNLVNWLKPVEKRMGGYNINSGDTFLRLLPHKFRNFKKASIKSPDGREWETEIEHGIIEFSNTYMTGIYRIIFDSGEMEFAVNLAASETNITPVRNAPFEIETVKAPSLTVISSSGVWKVFGVLAVFLLILEKWLRKRSAW